MPEQGRCISMGWATLSGPVVEDEERLGAAARSLAEKKGEQRTSETSGHVARQSFQR